MTQQKEDTVRELQNIKNEILLAVGEKVDVMTHHTTPHHTTPHHITSHHITSHHTTKITLTVNHS